MRFFNGLRDRERDGRDERSDRPRDDYDRRRDDYRGDDRDRGGDRYGDREREPRRSEDRGGDDRDRGRDPAPVDGELLIPIAIEMLNGGVDGPRKRRSRWGDASDKVDVAGLPTAVMGNVSQHELDNYAIHVRLEEINRKLRTGDVVPRDGQR